MDKERLDQTSEVLAEHSNSGTMHLLSAAQHFLTTRLLYQFIWKGGLSEASYDQLASEAWSIFVSPSIYSFHTWLIEVADPDTQEMMRSNVVDKLINRVRVDWEVWAAETKDEWLEEFVS